MSTPAVVFDRVTRTFGRTRAVDSLSLSVNRGEMFGLIGPDGSGKTTSIRLLCGLLHPDAGTIRVLDLDPRRDHRALTARVGYLSQRFSLYGDLSIDENIAFFADIHGVRDYTARRTHLLEVTQLLPFRDRLADRLSGGMKQKLALACTLIHEPDLIVLDEPTTGVDPVSRREFWKLLSRFLDAGITIVMSTPYLDEAERCSRIALLHDGRLLALDTPGALRAGLPGSVVEVVLPAPRDAMARLQAAGHPRVELFGDRLHVWTAERAPEAATAYVRALADRAGLPPHDARLVPASLEDVFMARVTGTESGTGTGTTGSRA